MKNALFAAAAALLFAGCGSGGSSSVAPSPTPTPAATPTPVPLANHLAAAPAQAFTALGLQSIGRRSAQSVNLGSGAIPTVVGATSPYYGSILTEILAWADNPQNAPVPEASLNATPMNASSSPISIASVGQDNSNLFASTYHDWVVQLQINKVGKGAITAQFADGTMGQIPVYVYDQWYLVCSGFVSVQNPWEWAYSSGVPTGVFGANSDMQVDCTNLNVVFPNGAAQLAGPTPDAWGNVASALTAVSTGMTSAGPLTVPVAALQLGTIYIVKLADGGYGKIMPLVNDGSTLAPSISGISLHDSPSGSGQFAF